MQLPFVSRKRHQFVVQLLDHYQRKSVRLEAAASHPRSKDGRFVQKTTRIGRQIRKYNTERDIRIENKKLAYMLGVQ